MSELWRLARNHPDPRTRSFLIYMVEQAIWGLSVLSRYAPTHFSQVNRYLSGVFYVASQISECSPWYILNGKLKRLVSAFKKYHPRRGVAAVTTGSATALQVPDNTIDYIFTDPPFGENIYYADLKLSYRIMAMGLQRIPRLKQ